MPHCDQHPSRLNACLAVIATAVCLSSLGCASWRVNSTDLSAEVAKPLDSRLAMGRLCERHHEDEKARTIYEGVLKSEPENPTALHRLAILSSENGKYDEAQDFFARAIAADPKSAEVHNDLGYSYFLQDRLQEAEA